MPYITQANLLPLLPEGWQLQALDDDDNGSEDAGLFASIRDAAEAAVNGVLSTQYTVPVASPESFPFLQHVTAYEAVRILYNRRGYKGEAYPHYKMWEEAWAKLNRIGSGKEPLGAATGNEGTLAVPRGTVISAPAKSYSSTGSAAA